MNVLAETKTCTKCGVLKPLDQFYKNRTRRDGLTYQCKDCRRTIRLGYKEAERRWWLSPERRAADNAYNKERRALPQNRVRERRHAEVYRTRYPEKKQAHRAVRMALLSGLLVRPEDCPKCSQADPKRADGHSGIHAHHPRGDDSPLDIEWLCKDCHAQEHSARSTQP